ncbi:MAG: alpha/beta fold hydrolase [Alphaproteobacteria bacterium]|nr:alpha/beta fold hydrolase [Alphaproteobacteria bacterium]
MPGASLLSFLHGKGVRPMLLDWGDGTTTDRQLTLEELILERMKPAFDWLHHTSGKRPLVLGYCMGGTLATALACLCQEKMAGLALLATPWHFDRGARDMGHSRSYHGMLASLTNRIGSAPVDLLQTLFAQIDPLNVPKKFARFAEVAPTSQAACRFVAIEDWLNDGVPLNAEVAAECLLDWYGSNAPARGDWRVDGIKIRPDLLDLPVCLAIPERDRIVPPDSALALASTLSSCDLIRPNAGHVGMVVGRNAEAALWTPLLQWLRQIIAEQKDP